MLGLVLGLSVVMVHAIFYSIVSNGDGHLGLFLLYKMLLWLFTNKTLNTQVSVSSGETHRSRHSAPCGN